MAEVEISWLARLCWALGARRWLLAVASIVAAGLLVVGCVAFYWANLYAVAVTMFLLGSLLFLAGALGSAFVDHGPSM